MDSDKFFGDMYDLVDVIKDTDRSFVALVYDKNAKRLCVMKERNPQSLSLYKILRDSDNPHVPKIFRLFERDGKLIVIEEHIDGQTLNELAEYRPEILTEKFIGNIFVQICDALVPLHKVDVIHRDLTPSNIMLTKENAVKLIDFSIARIFKTDSSNDTEFLGTRGYAAPEQLGVFELGQTDERTDIFILGTTIKNLLGKDYRGRLAKVLNRCTDLNPAARYQSVPDLIDAINRANKLHMLKRIGLTAATVCAIFLTTQFVNFKSAVDEMPPEKISSPPANRETTLPKSDDEENFSSDIAPPKGDLNSDVTNSLIDFTKNLPSDADNFELPDINVTPAPVQNRPPQSQRQTQPQSQVVEFAERPKLSLYLNGKLNPNRSEHSTAGEILISDDYTLWQRNDKGDYLFPANWTARLHIENFTAKDLLNPTVTVSFAREKISFDIPTVKSGQTFDVDIPVAGHSALKSNSHGKFSVHLKPSGGEKIPLLVRDLEVAK